MTVKKKLTTRMEMDDADSDITISPESFFASSAIYHKQTPFLGHMQRLRVAPPFFKGFLLGVALMSALFAIAALLVFRTLT